MAKNIKPGSWVTLGVSVAVAYTAAKWVAQRCSACVAPIMMVTAFLTSHYSEELNGIGMRIRRKVRSVRRWFGNLFRPNQAYAC